MNDTESPIPEGGGTLRAPQLTSWTTGPTSGGQLAEMLGQLPSLRVAVGRPNTESVRLYGTGGILHYEQRTLVLASALPADCGPSQFQTAGMLAPELARCPAHQVGALVFDPDPTAWAIADVKALAAAKLPALGCADPLIVLILGEGWPDSVADGTLELLRTCVKIPMSSRPDLN